MINLRRTIYVMCASLILLMQNTPMFAMMRFTNLSKYTPKLLQKLPRIAQDRIFTLNLNTLTKNKYRNDKNNSSHSNASNETLKNTHNLKPLKGVSILFLLGLFFNRDEGSLRSYLTGGLFTTEQDDAIYKKTLSELEKNFFDEKGNAKKTINQHSINLLEKDHQSPAQKTALSDFIQNNADRLKISATGDRYLDLTKKHWKFLLKTVQSESTFLKLLKNHFSDISERRYTSIQKLKLLDEVISIISNHSAQVKCYQALIDPLLDQAKILYKNIRTPDQVEKTFQQWIQKNGSKKIQELYKIDLEGKEISTVLNKKLEAHRKKTHLSS